MTKKVMTKNEALRQLREILVSLYSTKDSACLIADDAGLTIASIKLGDTIEDCWHEILKEADKHDKVQEIVQLTSERYAGRASDLYRVWHEYENSKRLAITGSIPISPLTENSPLASNTAPIQTSKFSRWPQIKVTFSFAITIAVILLFLNLWSNPALKIANLRVKLEKIFQLPIIVPPYILTGTPTSTPTSIATRIPDGFQPPANPITGTVWTDSVYELAFVYVPNGEFIMGSTDEQFTAAHNDCVNSQIEFCSFEGEKPQHEVNLDGFWIMQTEVTNSQYKKCVDVGRCTSPHNNSWNQAANSEYPVTDVDWNQANDYATWVGGRLPTEAEWEKAARGKDGRIYPWGNEWSGNRTNYCDSNCQAPWKDITGNDGYSLVAPINRYPENDSPYNAFDLAGNVGEWVADYYDGMYYKIAPNRNPAGPPTGEHRVYRGGSGYHHRSYLRTAFRGALEPTDSFPDLGFRVMRGQLAPRTLFFQIYPSPPLTGVIPFTMCLAAFVTFSTVFRVAICCHL